MTTVTQQQHAGEFDWRTDPNFRFEAPKAPEVEPVVVPSGGGGSNLMDYVSAAKQMRDGKGAQQSRGGTLLREARTAVGDGIGKLVGALDDDAGNQVQSRVAGMRMAGDKAQASAAADAYASAAAAATDPAQAQQFKDASANIARGAGVVVPDAAEGASTLAGTLAEGASRAIPAVGVMAGLGAFADGGEVGEQHKAFSRAWRDALKAEPAPVKVRQLGRRTARRKR
jgi:hypothetical protein